ncbi:hypothetical protein XELAEV_18036296mg [Xenopus laevis]|uniref:Ig-like domain-containing protein n=1 Tax=Xenopus laevis TaxID=8355 RepID=A0A974CH96_XENLA|nr:hypothetical protein XELAEV_18036296mg [Xenopus laevis]
MFFSTGAVNGQTPGYELKTQESVSVASGLCVEIPCTFNISANGNLSTSVTGIWSRTDISDIVAASTDASKVSERTKGRFTLTGKVHERNCSFSISKAQPEDQGTYVFRIEDRDIKYSYSWNKLNVTVTNLSEPTISPVRNLIAGKQITLTCTSHPAPQGCKGIITWEGRRNIENTTNYERKDEAGKVTSISNITFTPSQRDHESSLTCTVTYSGVSTNSSITLDVESLAKLRLVKCGEVRRSAAKLRLTQLRILVNLPHGVTYKCFAQNTHRSITATVTINVEWTHSLSSSEGIEEKKLRISKCFFGYFDHRMGYFDVRLRLRLRIDNRWIKFLRSFDRVPSIFDWELKSFDFEYRSRRILAQILVNRPLNIFQQEEVLHTPTFPIQQALHWVTILPLLANSMDIVPSGLNLAGCQFEVIEGTSLSLLCCAESNPPANLSWAKQNSTDPLNSSSGRLEISHVTTDNKGDYICQAKNKHGRSTLSNTVVIIYAPKRLTIKSCNINGCSVYDEHSSVEVFEGNSLYLQCKADSNPIAKLSWIKHTQNSTVIQTSPTLHLNVTKAAFENGGNYTCRAMNIVGNESKSIFVVIKSPTNDAFHLVGSFCGILVLLLTVIVITALMVKKCKQRRRPPEQAKENESSPPNNSEVVYSNIERRNIEQKPNTSLSSPNECKNREEDLQYVTLDFSRSKPNTSREPQETLYSEVRRN